MMGSRGCLLSVAVALAALALTGCGDDTGTVDRDAGGDAAILARCGPGDDPDSDFISSMDEGEGDADGDGVGNALDADSDGDGLADSEEAGDARCTTDPADTDRDGTPDFLDADSNGDGIPDATQGAADRDGDGTADVRDADTDGDGIDNVTECGGATCVDTDGDGTSDVFDDDTDGDTILDSNEGTIDPDRDGVPNFRDEESDGDGVPDGIEAGDADLRTPPVTCLAEVDPITGLVMGDGFADFSDADSDNDGLGDGEERDLGTSPCDVDTDGDGFGDLVEGAYQRVNCPAGGDADVCRCATNGFCGIPREDFFVVLPYMGDSVQQDLDFGTTIRVADIFFLTDTTASMAPTLARVKATVTTTDTGIIDRIRATVPDVWFGGGQHDDFPLGGWGAAPDQPFTLASQMTPRERAGEVQLAFDGMRIHGGSDGPESQTEALYQTMTGAGGTYLIGRSTYTMPRYGGDCLEGTYGAPCFREAALPIIVHFTDICSHNGPPGEAEYFCTPYGGLDPSPATWEQAMGALTSHGAKYVGVNVSGYRCEGVDPLAMPGTPCFFMHETTRATGSVDLGGNPLVYDLTAGGTSDDAFVDTIVDALETIATRVPFDVDTALRDDPTDPEGVDATRFIRSRMPACRATPATDPCWDAPVGVTHDAAVRGMDDTTFQHVVPGTRVKFRITFQNDFYRSNTTARVFVAFIDVRADHVTPLDTRQVFIVVPATSAGLPI